MKIAVSQAAADDLARLHDFLADKNAVAAGRAIAALISAVQSLETFPERGRPSGTPNVRELIVPFGRSGYCCATPIGDKLTRSSFFASGMRGRLVTRTKL